MEDTMTANAQERRSWFTGYAPAAIAFIAVILGLALSSLPNVFRFSRPPVPIIDGSLVKAFEKYYDEKFPLRTASINLWTAAQLVAFGEGRLGVMVGRDGWLYTNEEFSVAPDWNKAIDQNLAFMEWARGQMEAAGVRLVIAIVPEKAHIYPEYIKHDRQASAHQGLAERIVNSDIGRRAPIINLADVLKAGREQGQTYFCTDTHWTPLGAQIAAHAISAKIEAMGLAPATAKPAAFKIERSGQAIHHGDLLAFLPLEPMFPSLMPPEESIEKVRTVAIDEAAAGGDSLFGDTPIPEVALVGTSYSANPAWNFAGFLEFELNELVANYAKEGSGPFPPMAAYLLGDDFKAHRPRVVIWEMPERAFPARPSLTSYKLPADAFGRRTDSEKTN